MSLEASLEGSLEASPEARLEVGVTGSTRPPDLTSAVVPPTGVPSTSELFDQWEMAEQVAPCSCVAAR